MNDLIDRTALRFSHAINDDGKVYVPLAEVLHAPVVDAVPAVHGKWLHDKSGANFCSECMEYVYEDEEYHMILHTKYCPHCGAKMDGWKDGKQ